MSIALTNSESNLTPDETATISNQNEKTIALSDTKHISKLLLEKSLQQLLEHPEGKKFLTERKLSEIKLSDEELDSIAASDFSESQKQTIIEYKKKQLCDSLDLSTYAKELIKNVCDESKDISAKQQAWKKLLNIILKAYHLARDDVAKFKSMREMIEPLSVMVEAFEAEFDGKLEGHQAFAAQGAQAFFRVANFHGINDDVEVCNKWHNKVERFILNNGLEKTQELAILYNLRAGEISRRFPLCNQDGSLNAVPFPIESIYYFQKALDLHYEIGSAIEHTPHMQHVLMCLASVKAQELRHRLYTRPYTLELQNELKVEGDAIFNLLAELKPYIKQDDYRIAGTMSIESLLYMLQGDISNAVKYSRQALDHMPIEQTGQYSSLLNNAGDIHVFMGTALYMTTDLSEEIFKIFQNHPYAQMAKKMHDKAPFKIHPYHSKDELISIANTNLVVAVATYVKSYQLSHDPEKPERIYAELAKNALAQISVEEEFIEIFYFDEDIQSFFKNYKILDVGIRDVVPAHETDVDGQKGITIGFFAALENAWHDLQAIIEPYNPFASTPAPKP